ncbi:MAG TPA: DUF4010 domain-containing protein [Gemmatimonadaceae bacterium]|nr:DUF4010 domain-containing protein [Gemmatimonadaceae bacterium]
MDVTADGAVVLRLAVAALCGLAVGIEREWSGHAAGPHGRFAGVRTFFLIGGLGGVAGLFADAGSNAIALALLAGGLAITVAAYANASRGGGEAIDATTEVAALVVLALGALAGVGALAVAGGAAAVVVLALSEKARLHRAVARVGEADLRAAFQFAVLALVVLPVLPSGTYGPLGGVSPRELWMVVLVFSGLNYLGYLARRVVGYTRGDAVAGALGGVISSTAVTWQFSRRSREEDAAAPGLAAGVLAACTVLIPRLLVLSAILNHRVALALIPFLAVPAAAGAAMVAFSVVRPHPASAPAPGAEGPGSPLRLWSAIRMALAFQAALMAIHLVQTRLGEQGVLASAALLGLTDMDALTLSMNRLGEAPETVRLAARAIVIGVVANTVLKLGLALALGSARFRVLAGGGLALLLVVTAGTLVVLW